MEKRGLTSLLLSSSADNRTEAMNGLSDDVAAAETSRFEQACRSLYEGTSRRGLLAWLGKALIAAAGVTVVKVLPVDRTVDTVEASNHDCSSWLYCNCNCPRLCSCCVGGNNCMCPYGTLPSGSWFGCCRNPSGQLRLLEYADCCRSLTSVQCQNPNCSCTNPPGNQRCPPGFNCNRLANWCSGGRPYYCTTVCDRGAC